MSVLSERIRISKYSDQQLAETAFGWLSEEAAGARFSKEDAIYVRALKEEIVKRFIDRELDLEELDEDDNEE